MSTNHTDQDTSPDRQLARLEGLAEAHGWQVVDRVVERTSGAQILDRPPVARALERIIDGRADVLVVDHLYRLGRNTRELLEVVDTLHRVGGHFFDATNNIDTTTPLGEMIFTVYAAMGQFEIAERRAKVKEGIARARARGKRLGKPPTTSDGAKIRALELRKTLDENGDTRSWNDIVRQLHAEGFKSATRGAIVRAVLRMLEEERQAADELETQGAA